jgi:hypothetical protein
METPTQQPVNEPQYVNPKNSIFRNNILAFLIYYVGSIVIAQNQYLLGMGFWLLGLYVPHLLILFIISAVKYRKGALKESAQYALTALTLLVIGFAGCTAGFFLSSLFF